MGTSKAIGHFVLTEPTTFSELRDGLRSLVKIPAGSYPIMAEELHDGSLVDLYATVRLDGVIEPNSEVGKPGDPGVHAIVQRVRDLAHAVSEHKPHYKLAPGYKVVPAGPLVDKGHGKTYQALTVRRART